MSSTCGNNEVQVERQYLAEELVAAAEPEVDATGPLSVIPNFFFSALHITHFARKKVKANCRRSVYNKTWHVEDYLATLTSCSLSTGGYPTLCFVLQTE